VNLKHPLRQIETNPRDSRHIPDRLAHGRLPFRWGFDNDHLGTPMPFGAPSTPSFVQELPNGSYRPVPVRGSESLTDVKEMENRKPWSQKSANGRIRLYNSSRILVEGQ
jgi:hypothetical protein